MDLHEARARMRRDHLADEDAALADLIRGAQFGPARRIAAKARATGLVRAIRADDDPGLMEVFLAEYGLSTEEGVALMCLAEALLRVPDAETMDALIEDKIAPSEWGAHLGRSTSPLVNASTWALMLTGRVLKDGEGLTAVLKGAVRRLGEPVIRVAVGRAMRELGAQFVLGETIDAAVARGRSRSKAGFTYSYDMLGEAARTAEDADGYFRAYAGALARLSREAAADLRDGPGLSIKLSALHPRYEEAQRDRVMAELVPRVSDLVRQARAAGMGLNIDAEEQDRLELSLDVIEAVARDPALAGWDGFGVVVQAYGKRAAAVIDWLDALARDLDRRFMVRLVKGAYWDSEIKRAQVEGLAGFPVWTRKVATDAAYLACAERLLALTPRLYPQFATHNAHTVAAILEMAPDRDMFEFQRLHGMGASLHDKVRAAEGTRCRIYAPVGAHRDLLAYLVRRLLENGANSSFVNQIVDESVPPEVVAADPFEALEQAGPNRAVVPPDALFAPERRNSSGWDLSDRDDLARLEAARAPFRDARWEAGPILAAEAAPGAAHPVRNPADPADVVGESRDASADEVEAALGAAAIWDAPADDRAAVLIAASDLFEARAGEIFALLTREAGKTLRDGVAELREAVDFLRYYAARGRELDAGPRGMFACISPWNFPLAIFTGQIAAALAAGNAVVAKPAEATPLIAALAVRLLHEAGVPRRALQLLPGDGAVVGAALASDPRIAGTLLHRLHRHGAAHQPGDGASPRSRGAADRRDRRPERDDRRFDRAPRAGGPRHRRLRLPVRGPALFRAARALRPERRGGDAAADALRRDGRASARRPLGSLDGHRPGDRRRRPRADRGACRQGPGRGTGAEGNRRAGPRPFRRAHGDPRGRHRGSGGRGVRPDPARGPLRGGGPRRGGRGDQRDRLRADLRHPQPDRRPRRPGDAAAAGRQHLRQPQPDRRDRRLAAVRRRGAVGDRPQGRRSRLRAALCGRPASARDFGGRPRRRPRRGAARARRGTRAGRAGDGRDAARPDRRVEPAVDLGARHDPLPWPVARCRAAAGAGGARGGVRGCDRGARSGPRAATWRACSTPRRWPRCAALRAWRCGPAASGRARSEPFLPIATGRFCRFWRRTIWTTAPGSSGMSASTRPRPAATPDCSHSRPEPASGTAQDGREKTAENFSKKGLARRSEMSQMPAQDANARASGRHPPRPRLCSDGNVSDWN